MRECGSDETGVPMHSETPSQSGPRGSCRLFENWAKYGLRGQKTEKAALLSPLTAHGLRLQTDDGLQEQRVVGHTNPASSAQHLKHRG